MLRQKSIGRYIRFDSSEDFNCSVLFKDADFENLTAVSCPVSAPGLLEIVGFAAGLCCLREFYILTSAVLYRLSRPIDTGYPGFPAMAVSDEGVECLGAPDIAFPGFRIRVANFLGVLPTKPGV